MKGQRKGRDGRVIPHQIHRFCQAVFDKTSHKNFEYLCGWLDGILHVVDIGHVHKRCLDAHSAHHFSEVSVGSCGKRATVEFCHSWTVKTEKLQANISHQNSDQVFSPPYKSSMATMWSPELSRWVMAVVVPSPEENSMPVQRKHFPSQYGSRHGRAITATVSSHLHILVRINEKHAKYNGRCLLWTNEQPWIEVVPIFIQTRRQCWTTSSPTHCFWVCWLLSPLICNAQNVVQAIALPSNRSVARRSAQNLTSVSAGGYSEVRGVLIYDSDHYREKGRWSDGAVSRFPPQSFTYTNLDNNSDRRIENQRHSGTWATRASIWTQCLLFHTTKFGPPVISAPRLWPRTQVYLSINMSTYSVFHFREQPNTPRCCFLLDSHSYCIQNPERSNTQNDTVWE